MIRREILFYPVFVFYFEDQEREKLSSPLHYHLESFRFSLVSISSCDKVNLLFLFREAFS